MKAAYVSLLMSSDSTSLMAPDSSIQVRVTVPVTTVRSASGGGASGGGASGGRASGGGASGGGGGASGGGGGASGSGGARCLGSSMPQMALHAAHSPRSGSGRIKSGPRARGPSI